MNAIAFVTLERVKKSDGLTDEQRERVATLLEGWVANRPPTQRTNRAVCEATGIDISSLSKIRSKDRRAQKRIEGIGLNTVLRLREMLRMPIDEILDLPPLAAPAAAPTPPSHPDAPPEFAWAARIARIKGVPDATIRATWENCRERRGALAWKHVKWGDAIMEFHHAALKAEAELREVGEKKRAHNAAPRSRRKTA